jgi:hypothetical protein
MTDCTLLRHLRLVRADMSAYRRLARYHYRNEPEGNRPAAAVFALLQQHPAHRRFGNIAGVIVYSMPAAALQLRNLATAGRFTGLGGQAEQLKLVNENIRCISRVIIDPRYRGLHLATSLVAQTMPQMNTPIVEALAVMGRVHPFFELAGMTAYTGPLPARCAVLAEALDMVGVPIHADSALSLDAAAVNRKLAALPKDKSAFIERYIRQFLQAYGRRRNMPPGPERTRFILSRLAARPVYYIWFNEKLWKSN